MSSQRVLVANRGEVAIRIMRTAHELGFDTVAVHGADDVDSPHVRHAGAATELAGRGVAAYLDADAIADAARNNDCAYVHPGYGFLSESAALAAAVENAGLIFVGPTPDQLELFGDKVSARAAATDAGVPVLPASAILGSATDLHQFLDASGAGASQNGPVYVLKAVGGGGGRGMRVLSDPASFDSNFEQAAAEAGGAFGDARLYAERYLPNARHIEVQVVGDGRGAVIHLYERDCSLQRRHQKLVEIAPAPRLDADVRNAICRDAVAIAEQVQYRGLGTFEFLLDVDSGEHFFIETNARLQVEHTVTEEILGLDLVAIQFAIAGGSSLADLGLTAPPPISGTAVQLRINAERIDAEGNLHAAGGSIARFLPAGGPGIRVDAAAEAGQSIHPAFDSLIAKLIVHVPHGGFDTLVRRAQRAAAETVIAGCDTNLPLLRALLADPAIREVGFNTAFIGQHLPRLVEHAVALGDDDAAPADAARSVQPAAAAADAPAGVTAVAAPMRGSVVQIDVEVGARVARGQAVGLLEAMKMHHDVLASVSGEVMEILHAPGDVVDEGEAVLWIRADAADDGEAEIVRAIDVEAPRADLEEVRERHALGLDENRPAAVEKRRKFGARTARENVDDLCDADSFVEYGALAIAAQRRRRSLDDLQQSTPADGMVAGFGTVNAAHFGEDATRCAVLAYDYTVLAGTQGHHNHKKKDRMFELAAEWETPVVFFTEGGGGRPGDVDTEDLFMAWLDIKTFATWPQLSGTAPRIAINSGRCFAGNAVIFGCADITIATKNSNIGLAGPAMIEGGGLGRFKPEDIGPIDVQTNNGVVDIAVEDEAEGTAVARQLLGCFQGKLSEWDCPDQRRLRHLIPEDRLRVYDIRAVIEGLADTGSVIELRPEYGVGLITALVRVEGQAFGLIANDPRHLGGAIDGDGGEKGGRFLQMCDTFGLPIISLCDTPGFMVGPDSEKTAAVRRGSRLVVASANLTVPLFSIVIRKGYGLGAQAMTGGSFKEPFFTIAWPTAEMGPMGLEGAVELGFRKELEATADKAARDTLFNELVGQMYTKGKGISVAQVFEIDAVIDPAETRQWLTRGYRAAGGGGRRRRGYVDVW